ncbi:hypothetical protein CRF12_003500 [Salmonella enterica subsp. enterica serovar Glostrup]|nr:hypothetical protein [Salmonella enterica subsp. enterica serovar Glostrup]EDU8905320.1 hypothetical protein [Salmonella enterica subsp. enterica]EDW6336683.1 hypothetical protein [Salmonella enterica subsp. enterica serovar Hadar]EDX4099041.1 hypothetical protein [Salmonella enterica]EDQ7107975.1 hypothetical protein [Salmonella enterica subsp. enterica serovar Glostrup]
MWAPVFPLAQKSRDFLWLRISLNPCRIAAAPSAVYSSGQFSFISNTQIVKLFPTI